VRARVLFIVVLVSYVIVTQTKLRGEWNSSCFVQSDCCDSIDAVVDHGYTDTLEEVGGSRWEQLQ
jgi:hypothetical protein